LQQRVERALNLGGVEFVVDVGAHSTCVLGRESGALSAELWTATLEARQVHLVDRFGIPVASEESPVVLFRETVNRELPRSFGQEASG
jgi:hypothetical protein